MFVEYNKNQSKYLQIFILIKIRFLVITNVIVLLNFLDFPLLQRIVEFTPLSILK